MYMINIWVLGFLFSLGIQCRFYESGADELGGADVLMTFLAWPVFLGYVVGDVVVGDDTKGKPCDQETMGQSDAQRTAK